MKTMMFYCSVPLCCLTIALSGCGGATDKGGPQSSEWTIPLGSYDAIRHSPLKQINNKNADKMLSLIHI